MSAAERLLTPTGQPFELDGSVCRIQIRSGEWFTIDAVDFERVSSFRWHAKRQRSRPGKIYIQRTVRVGGRQTSVALHRSLVDASDGVVVDHRDGNPLNNARSNLRITDARGNSTNVTSSKRQKLGGFKGVSWNKNAGKWQASICAGEIKANGKRKQLYLGLYEDPAVAARVYDDAAAKYFGTFASLNFPEEREFAEAFAEHGERAAVADVLAGKRRAQ